jgi:hypothetical protein
MRQSQKGTRDFRGTTLLAQQVVNKNTNAIVNNFTTGKGLVDRHFFDNVVAIRLYDMDAIQNLRGE